MDSHKPIFHITADKGWINDPNGIVKFQGKYHVFYQHHPYSCVWGPMHWGHVVSDDLLHWTYLPYALVPGDEFDRDGCFSGSSLVVGDTLYIVYTGFKFAGDSDKIRQIQCLASSKDGINFVKHGVIIDEKGLPDKYKPCDFRDPHLVYKDGEYLLFVAAKKKSGGGSIVVFKSQDLKKWTFLNDVLSHNSAGLLIVKHFEELGLNPSEVNMVLCGGHGPFAWGKNADKAVYNGTVLEEICKMALNTLTLNPEATPLPDYIVNKHYMRKHGPNAYYGQGK